MWAGKRVAPLNNDFLFFPTEEGGKDLLSIKDRNDAIALKDIRDFLTNEGPNRAKWCDLAKHRFNSKVSQGPASDESIRISPYYQTWKPLQNKLPQPLKKMLKTAMKFNLKFDALALKTEVKNELPVFLHLGGKEALNRHNNSVGALCLRANHESKLTGDLLKMIQRDYSRHNRRRNCACPPCKADRQAGCRAPFKCLEEAITILDCVYEKWDPRSPLNQPLPNLTEDEKETNLKAFDEDGTIMFDPKVQLETCIDGFRIFGEVACGTPAHQLDLLNDAEQPSEETIYIGNSYELNEDGEISSHGGLWYREGDTRNASIPVGTDMASKTSGEAAAILHTIQDSPQEVTLNFKIGSSRLIKALTINLEANENNDWLENDDRIILKAIVAALRGRGTKCTFQKLDAQSEPAMEMARKMASKHPNTIVNGQFQTMIPPAYDLNGMKLRTGTQRTFYRAIKSRRRKPDRMKTTIMLDRTRHVAKELSGRTPTDGEIWKSLNHKDISRTTRAYLWRGMHQAYKIGEHWRNIPTFEHWAECRHCAVDDSMEHILIDCEAPGREKLWNLAQELWEKTGHNWPEINLGSIFACGLAHFKTATGKRDKGADRLFRILISETAHLIWKLRCTRVIERGSDPTRYFSEKEIHNRWLSCINQRLRIDLLLTDRHKYGNRASDFKLVLSTWKHVLMDAENLQDTQILQSRVLVGIDPLR
ncbi:hypothetical protein B0H13DRAFT_1654551 [Mycena leptocephala]|nr:hypothetical protein B0H13DRAFT_1654551 [Mycena leptocephala]